MKEKIKKPETAWPESLKSQAAAQMKTLEKTFSGWGSPAYIILSSDSIVELTDDVNCKLSEDKEWRPTGGVFFCEKNGVWYQALTRVAAIG